MNSAFFVKKIGPEACRSCNHYEATRLCSNTMHIEAPTRAVKEYDAPEMSEALFANSRKKWWAYFPAWRGIRTKATFGRMNWTRRPNYRWISWCSSTLTTVRLINAYPVGLSTTNKHRTLLLERSLSGHWNERIAGLSKHVVALEQADECSRV